MIKIEDVEVAGFRHAIKKGMRNPKNSWDRSDSIVVGFVANAFILGDKDAALADSLNKSGSEHSKYRRTIMCWFDLTAPLYFWKEFDTYRIGVEKNSCSTMHKIHSRPLEMDDFSTEHLDECSKSYLAASIDYMNRKREKFVESGSKDDWWQMIQLLPSSYNQKRTVMASYEALSRMYEQRKNHKLDEWKDFCTWIESLPYAEKLIINSR